ncbi:MAG: efflux RND transporter permease subunit [Deltaproteobacteria bacterium]|nr:efflux RND transporter permease subunit [Deltaproteobacteria bacterium]
MDKAISFNDYLKLVNYATNQYQADLYTLPEAGFELRMLANSFKTMLGQDMLDRFMSPDFSRTNILLRTHLASSKAFLTTQKTIEEYLRKAFPGNFTFQVTGLGIVISHSSQLITEGQVRSLGLTLILVFAIMFLLFMSYKVGIIGILPNCFPIVVSFGVMGWTGIPLSMATSLIATIAIGLAVDDTIHYLVGYNHEFKRDLDKKEALRKTVQHIGRPIIFTTLTISLGFSVLMGSSFKPTAVFGLMMVITMFSALVADLILLPSLMLHVELVTIWDLLKLKLGKDPHKRIPLFNGLSRTQIHYVLMAGNLKTHPEGAVIFRKGQVSDSMYVIVSGELEVVDTPGWNVPHEDSGMKQVIATLKTGDVVGEMGMIRSCERSATVMASKPTELLQINERMVRRLQWLYPPTAHRFFFNLMRILCDRLECSTTALLDQTITDRISGLRTREFFRSVLRKEAALTQSIKGKSPLSFFIIKVEDLPKITLRNGDEITDTILKETGRVLKERVGDEDHVCRFDSNQFAGLLPGTPLKEAKILCEEICAAMENKQFEEEMDALSVQVSYGVSSTEEDAITDAHALIDAAFASLQDACAA